MPTKKPIAPEHTAIVVQAARPNRIKARLLRAALRVDRTIEDADFVRMALTAIWRRERCYSIPRGGRRAAARANVVKGGLTRQLTATVRARALRHITAKNAAASCAEKRGERTYNL